MRQAAGVEIDEFLLDRIAEDEQAAKAALPGGDDADGGAWAEYGEFTNRQGNSAVALAYRYSPARVLAECEAKRRMVRHAQHVLDQAWQDGALRAVNEFNATMPLRLLALPYADHPDYREEWRP